jgi:plastocyanin
MMRRHVTALSPVLAASAVLAACILSWPVPAEPATHTVLVFDFSFSPSELTIPPGDTVRWQWQAGFHTTTSGASSNPADNPGSLWDSSINSSSPIFEYTFANEGDFPYFCRFHELSGMKGTITVDSSVPVEGSTWGRIKQLYAEPE